jgi:hypothetical protein
MPDPISYFVPDADIIPVIAQPKNMACWATVATMLFSWKDKVCYSIETAMDSIGQEFRQIYEDNTGLFPDKIESFANASGVTIEWPVCGTPESILGLLKDYGPIIIIDDEDPSTAFCIHARMITGIFGDGTSEQSFVRIIDPAGGQTYDEPFNIFESKYEEMAAARGWTIQIMHY